MSETLENIQRLLQIFDGPLTVKGGLSNSVIVDLATFRRADAETVRLFIEQLRTSQAV